jgi:general secretion pathway protein G
VLSPPRRRRLPLTRAKRTPGGFTMVEVVVAMVLVAILAAVLIPVVAERVREGQTSAVAQTMDALSQAVAAYRVDVRRYPTRLEHLTSPPATAYDPCGRQVPAAFLDQWRGPYLAANITSAGLRVGDATVQDSLETDPASFTTSTVGYLLIETDAVDEETAEGLDRAFDGVDDLTEGVVRWTATSGGQGTLLFGIRIRGC